MNINQSAKKLLIRKSLIRLMLVNIFVMAATNLCGVIDNLVTSRTLGVEALSALGYFAPVASVTGISYVIILGAVTLSGNLIGSGQAQRVNALFFNCFLAIAVISVVISAACIAFRESISTYLGARGEVHRLLCLYIVGYMPSVVFQALCALLMSLIAFINDIRRTYISTVILLAGNLLADLTLGHALGIFGIGLASTISSLVAFVVLLRGYMDRGKILRMEIAPIQISVVWKAAVRGSSSLLFTIGLFLKNALMNTALNTYVGAEGIAVASVLGTVCAIAGTVSGGCANAYSALAGLYFGEQDRGSFLTLFRMAVRMGQILCWCMVAAFLALSTSLSGLFFVPDTDVWRMGQRMFLLGFLFLPFNLLLNLLLKSRQAQGKLTLVNLFSLAETALIGLLVLGTIRFAGTDAAWLANTWVDLLCVSVILVIAFIYRKSVSLSAQVLTGLPDDFGASEDEILEFSVSDIGDVSSASEAVVSFCGDRGTAKKAFYAGLCVEELTRNVIMHGGNLRKRFYLSVRVVARDDIMIRIQDNCREFDPRKRMKMVQQGNDFSNFGLRIVAGMGRSVDYYNNAGINTTIITL